ncbi:MAG: hypothetical protein ACRYGR_05415 [Janthinobacterium lividum]
MKKSIIYKSFYLSTIISTLAMATNDFETPTKPMRSHIQKLENDGIYDGLTPSSKQDMEDIDRKDYLRKFNKEQTQKRQQELDRNFGLKKQEEIDEIRIEGEKKTQELQTKIKDFTFIKQQDNDRIQQLVTEIENLDINYKITKLQLEDTNTCLDETRTQLNNEQQSIKDIQKELEESKNLSQQEIKNLTTTLESRKKLVSLLKIKLEEATQEHDKLEGSLSTTQIELRDTQANLVTTKATLSQTSEHLSIVETALTRLTSNPSTPSPSQNNSTNSNEILPQTRESLPTPEVALEATPNSSLVSQPVPSRLRGINSNANRNGTS